MWQTIVKNRIEFYPCLKKVMNTTKNQSFKQFVIVFLLAGFLIGCGGYTAITFHLDAPAVTRVVPKYPQAIVVYDSWSGNTELIAEVIADKLRAPAVHVMDTGEYELADYDFIVVGSPVHEGFPTRRIAKFLDGLEKPPLSAVFVTFGAPGFGPFTANLCLDKMEKKLGGTSLGRFKCHGFHQIMRTYPDHPDEKDESEAAQFAAGLLERCATAVQPEKTKD